MIALASGCSIEDRPHDTGIDLAQAVQCFHSCTPTSIVGAQHHEHAVYIGRQDRRIGNRQNRGTID